MRNRFSEYLEIGLSPTLWQSIPYLMSKFSLLCLQLRFNSRRFLSLPVHINQLVSAEHKADGSGYYFHALFELAPGLLWKNVDALFRWNLQNDFTLLPLHSFGLPLARSTYVPIEISWKSIYGYDLTNFTTYTTSFGDTRYTRLSTS